MVPYCLGLCLLFITVSCACCLNEAHSRGPCLAIIGAGWGACSQIPVPADKLGYLVGRNGTNIDSLKAKTGVSVVNMDSTNGCVRVMGVASSVQSATLLVRALYTCWAT